MTVTNLAELYLSDGSTFINLLSKQNGFALQAWQPLTPEPKGGGIWQESPLSDSRRLVARQLGNILESFTLAGRGGTVDLLIYQSQEIRRLLEKAINYWTTEWQDTPVYLLARGINESNVRYGLLYDYRAPGDGNPFASPFTGPDAAIFGEWQLILEHSPWTETPPGVGTAIQTSGLGTFNSVEYGRAATTTDEVYLANKQNIANISHIYSFSTDVGWSGNLFGAALPYNYFGALPAGNLAVEDAIYFISSTALTNSGPFASLVLDLATVLAGTGITTLWEYWNGAAATTLTVQDNTRTGTISFGISGVNSVHWMQPSTWAASTLVAFSGDAGAPVVTGFMVRMVVSAVTLGSTLPSQQNRQPYSVTWASALIASGQVGGDIPALALHDLFSHSGTRSVLADLTFQRAIIGLRSTARGASFVPAINLSDEQNPTGITASEVASAAVAMVTDIRAPSGRAIQWNVVLAAGPVSVATIAFSSVIASHFYGRYRAFLRLTVDTGTANDIALSLYFRPSVANTTGQTLFKTVTLPFIDEWLLVDFGQVVIPASNVLSTSDIYPTYGLSIEIASTVTTNLKLYDLWLIPIDENAVEALANSASVNYAVIEGEFLEIDSILYPKAPTPARALQRLANEQVVSVWQPISPGVAYLQANAEQRVHILTAILDQSLTDSRQQSFPSSVLSIQSQRQQRYLSMRGAR